MYLRASMETPIYFEGLFLVKKYCDLGVGDGPRKTFEDPVQTPCGL